MLSRDEFNALSGQILDLHVRWHQYNALYSGDDADAKLEVMNASAPTFFALDRDVWLDSIFQAISRLMDRSTIAGNATMGLSAVVTKLDDPLKVTLQPLLDEIGSVYSAGIKEWRNNRLSHSNKDYHLGLSRLPDVPIADVKTLVLKFEQLINTISLALYDETGAYFETEIRNGAEKLLAILKQWKGLQSMCAV